MKALRVPSRKHRQVPPKLSPSRIRVPVPFGLPRYDGELVDSEPQRRGTVGTVFVAAAALAARQSPDYVASVCTGSLVLAAAGLLKGFRATSHWYVRDLLPLMGATLDPARVVEDRNRITGDGVTAGIDFGLMAARLTDEAQAKLVQLVIEYDPQPPFGAGSPEAAGRVLADDVRSRRGPLIEAARRLAVAAGRVPGDRG